MRKISILHTETLKKWGGQQNRVLNEVLGLSKRGHKVVLVCNPGSIIAGKAVEAGIKVYQLSMSKRNYLLTVPKMMRIIREEDVEIVSTHSSVDSWTAGIAAKLTGRKLVRFRHNLYPVGRDPLTRLIYAVPDKIVAISDTVQEVLLKCGLKKERITVIYSAVKEDVFSMQGNDLREELKIHPETLVIGNTATFTQVKGQKYLFQAFNSIFRKYPCVMLFAGRISEASKNGFLDYVAPELRDKIIFLGHREDISRVLKTIDIFVYPSFLEGLGTALLEAMSMERPVAVSDIPTFRNFIREGINGVFFKSENTESMAEKVILLAGDANLRHRLGENAKRTILEKFSIDEMLNRTEALYLEVLNVQ